MEMRFNDIVRALRKQKGITQLEMSARIGVNLPNYSRMESRDRFSTKYLYKIAEALDMKLEINFTEKEK